MRAWFLVALAACGRLDFDSVNGSSTTSDAATTDAQDIGSAPDGGGAGSVTLTGIYLVSGDGVRPTAVLTLDLVTGDVSTVGTIAASAGKLTALTAVDANTLYAAGNGHLIKIELSPFTASIAAPITTDTLDGMETEGQYLTAVDSTSSMLLLYDTANLLAAPTTKPLGIPAEGGDIAQASYALGAYYFSNKNHVLYNIYTATGNSTVAGASINTTVTGMFSVASYTQYYITSSDLDAVIPIAIADGTTGAAIKLCHPCPGTPYDLLDGDATSVTP